MSTFCTMATPATKTTWKAKQVKVNNPVESTTINTEWVFSASMLSEQDLGFLLSHIMQAIQMQHNRTNNSSKVANQQLDSQ